MTAEVEAEAVELDRLGDAPDGAVRLEDRAGSPTAAEDVGRRQPRWSSSEDGGSQRFSLRRKGFVLRLPPQAGKSRFESRRLSESGPRPTPSRWTGIPRFVERTVDGFDRADDVEPDRCRRCWGAPFQDRLREICELQRERLGCLDPRRHDVARAVAQLVFAECLRIGNLRARVEDPDRLVGGVVVDDHLLRPDDRRPAKLARREPGKLDMRHSPGGVPKVDESDVRNVRQETAAAYSRDFCGKPIEPVTQNREVMWAEIPDDAYVGLVQPEIHATRGDEIDLAQLAAVDQALDRRHRRAVEERVPRHQDEALFLGDVGQLARPVRTTQRVASRRRRACPPRARPWRARSAWKRVWRLPPRRACRPRSISSKRDVGRHAGVAPSERLQWLRPGHRRDTRRRRRARPRGCARGSAPSSPDRRCADRASSGRPSAGLSVAEHHEGCPQQQAQIQTERPAARIGDVEVERLTEGGSGHALPPATAPSVRPERGSARTDVARRARARTG